MPSSLAGSGQNKPVYVFVDASNLWEAQKSRGQLFDYRKLSNYIKQKFNATKLEVFYYSAYPRDGTRDYSLAGKHRFFLFLKKDLGF